VKLAAAGAAGVAEGGQVLAIEPSPRAHTSLASGSVTRVTAHAILSKIHIDRDSAGVALFNETGEVVALTTPGDDATDTDDTSSPAIRIDDARPVIAEAQKKTQAGAPPHGVLPMEPDRALHEHKMREAARGRAGSLSAYMVPASDFDVALITPLLVYGAHHQGDRQRGALRNPGEMQPALRALEDFGAWADYVSDYPPVLLVRVTPKLVEGFWTTVARGAASTQGVSVPPIRRVKTPFGSLRAFCGDVEVTPIHPFRIEHRAGRDTVVDEGLYAFDPDALGPACPTVRLQIASEKTPDKPDVRVVDPKIVRQIHDDFAPYR
jgi:hypothetical protein